MQKWLFLISLSLVPKIILGDTLMERSLDTPIGWYYLTNTTEPTLKNFAVQNGFRIINIKKLPGTTDRYATSMVKNLGQYQVKGWWWYYGSANLINSKLAQHKARIIDLESYEENGERKFNAIMVSNTGNQAKAWWWYFDQTQEQIAQNLAKNNAHLVNLGSYDTPQGVRHSVIMIRNTGADPKGWWTYFNVNQSFITGKLIENNAKPFDIARRSNGNFDIIMVKNDGIENWWSPNKNARQIEEQVSWAKSRIIDMEPYILNREMKFVIITIENPTPQ